MMLSGDLAEDAGAAGLEKNRYLITKTVTTIITIRYGSEI
jgi:hypothetical protein